ncbi:MAG: phytanoyl-CoA dioxygenase family protein [Kofleriaceae bacterium]
MLTADHHKQLAERGFLVLPDLLHDSLLSRLRLEAEAVARQELVAGAAFEGLVCDVVQRNPVLSELSRSKALTGVARELINGATFFGGDLFRVQAGTGQRYWHRDPIKHQLGAQEARSIEIQRIERSRSNDGLVPVPLPPHAGYLQITFTVYLQDVSLDEGPLHILLGSHRWPYRDHTSIDEPYYLEQRPLDGEVALPCRAGDVIVQVPAIWHTGSANRGSHDCYMLLLDFGPGASA